MHIDNNSKEEPTQELDNVTLTAGAKYPINFKNEEKNLYEVYTITEATILIC